MLQIRRAAERGHAQLSWLDSHFTFSFAEYHDPAHMGFRSLRVINDDVIAPGGGFGTHGHRDMEIVTYVLDGALAHKDSLGTGSVIRPGEVQRMSAGTGIQHSEFNQSKVDPVHLLQIWIIPEKAGLEPSYEQRQVDLSGGELQLIASPKPQGNAVKIHQDTQIYAAKPGPQTIVEHHLAADRFAWLHVARGEIEIDGQQLSSGDAAAFAGPSLLRATAAADSEILLFDLA